MTRVLVNSNGKAFTTSNNRVLSSSGITPSGSISITENDTYDVTSYASAVVNVSGGGSSPVIELLNVTPTTSAQTITASGGVDGYSPITVSAVTASIDSNITAGNIKKNVQILGVTGSYEGSGGGSGNYALLDRITDDSNNEIGTVSGFFTDGNGVEYAVVCLDAQYRLNRGEYCNTFDAITNLPEYQNQSLYSATETATTNTQLILDWCTANSYTSTACTHCRSKSFTINGTTYYGQLPNIVELIDIFRRRVGINSADTSASSYPSLIVSTDMYVWSSSQYDSDFAWNIINNGAILSNDKIISYGVFPILEIPNQ